MDTEGQIITASVTVDRTEWKTTGRGPHVTVAGFLFDVNMRFPALFRGPGVRSVKNAWSLPSGLHENGLSMAEQLMVEGMEELNALPIGNTRHRYLGVYENIIPKESWHWVVNMLALYPVDLTHLENKEPDKHPEMTLCRFSHRHDGTSESVIVRCDSNLPVTGWAPGLDEWIQANSINFEKIEREIQRRNPTDQFAKCP